MENFIKITTSKGKEHLLNCRYIINVSLNSAKYTMITVIVGEVEPKYIDHFVVNESVDEINRLIQASQR